MKRFLSFLAITLVLASASFAQKQKKQRSPFTYGIGEPHVPTVDHTLDELVAARAKLVYWYVLSSSNYAWGVSVCGYEDVINGDENGYLTIYVYKDSLVDFKRDFAKAATKNPGGSLGVDGISVVIEVIDRPRPKQKGLDNEPAKTERNDRQPTHSNSSGNAVVFGRPSRA
jgi:hypothetical protein